MDTRGLYNKYSVIRNDGKDSQGCKHANCFLFVLDATHDPHARKALEAYIESCSKDFPELANDLVRKLIEIGPC
jgi:hypothetical protein